MALEIPSSSTAAMAAAAFSSVSSSRPVTAALMAVALLCRAVCLERKTRSSLTSSG